MVLAYRHPAAVRLTHWINVLCVLVLALSGVQILNAHPALYWGSQSNFADPWVRYPWGLPGWPMLPTYRDLAAGRNWHFFFAWAFVINGLIYLAFIIWRARLARDLAPTRAELAGIGATIKEHARFHFPRERRYNVLQKLAYLAMIFGLLPLMLLTGLAMSPGMNAALPGLLDIFGGRQSARTLHFIAAAGIMLFVVAHVALVILAGFWNTMRSMITGWYALDPPLAPPTDKP